RLDARHGSFDAIPALLQGTNMRRLTLQEAFWDASGALRGRGDLKMDPGPATELREDGVVAAAAEASSVFT
ncbi:99_t:CDS:2, partial [Acaulospora colombiana]